MNFTYLEEISSESVPLIFPFTEVAAARLMETSSGHSPLRFILLYVLCIPIKIIISEKTKNKTNQKRYKANHTAHFSNHKQKLQKFLLLVNIDNLSYLWFKRKRIVNINGKVLHHGNGLIYT